MKNVKILTWFNFFTDFSLYSPFAILYFTQISGSFVLGMSVFSIAMASSALAEIPTGIFSDKIGRKRTVLLGAISYTICTVFYASGSSYLFLVMGAIIEGIGRSFYSGNNNALLYDTLLENKKEERFHEYLGKVSAMFQIALAISALAGSVFAGFSLNLVVWLSVIPQIICIILATHLVEPKVHGKNESGNIYAHLQIAVKEFIRNKRLRLLSTTDVLKFGIGEAAFYFNSTFIALLWPVWAIGIVKSLNYGGASLSFQYSGKIIDRFGAPKVLWISSAYNRISNLIALIFPTVFSPILIATNSLGYGASSVSTSMLMQKEYTKAQRATMDSLNSLAGSLFFAVFGICLGAFADRYGVILALIVVQILSSTTLLVYYKLFHKKSQNH